MVVRSSAIRTLVVDDSEEFLSVARDWVARQDELDLAGTARSGVEALEMAEQLRPELILMDAVMPGMDGFEATRRIKSDGTSPWIVVLSFHDSRAARHEAWVSGADGFVSKADLGKELLPLVLRLAAGETWDDDPGRPGPPPAPTGWVEAPRSTKVPPDVENEQQCSSVGFSSLVEVVRGALRRVAAAARNLGRAQALVFEGPEAGAEKFRAARLRKESDR